MSAIDDALDELIPLFKRRRPQGFEALRSYNRTRVQPSYLIVRDYCGHSTVVDEAYTYKDAVRYRASFVQGSGLEGVVRIMKVEL